LGKLAYAGVDGGEAVSAGRTEVAKQSELIEDSGRSGKDVGGWRFVVQLAEEGDEAVNKRGVGVGKESKAAIAARRSCYPNSGYTTVNAVGVGALSRRDVGATFGAIEDKGKAFLWVIDRLEVDQELGVAAGEKKHRGRKIGDLRIKNLSSDTAEDDPIDCQSGDPFVVEPEALHFQPGVQKSFFRRSAFWALVSFRSRSCPMISSF
jgi:hypothetical protein